MKNKAFYIGNIEIKNRVILAPMAGITSFSYRQFMSPFGCGLVYTEMISDCGLLYGNEETKRLSYTDNTEHPLALQLFGGTKENILKSIDVLLERKIPFDILDLNLACPVPKVTKTGAGSAWLQDQDALYDMMKAVCEKVSCPVSAKIRLGYNDVNVEDTVQTLEKAGVKFIAIHARTKKELYGGKPDFSKLSNVRNLINIPFAVSGNIYTVEDALEALRITKADAIMVARGGVGNPNLVKNINLALNGEDYSEVLDFEEQKKYLLDFSRMLIDEKGEKRAIGILRGIAPKFFLHIPLTKPLRGSLSQETNSLEDIEKVLNDFNINQEL